MEQSTYETIYQQETDEYVFTTIAGITYTCYFFSAADIFTSYPDVASLIYGFNPDVVSGDVKRQGTDERIGNTVVSIVEKFLIQNTTAVVYLCDTTDSRQALRKRKFDSWFKRFDKGNITKLDGETIVSGSLIYNTLLVSNNNPSAERLISVFISLNEDLKDKTSGE